MVLIKACLLGVVLGILYDVFRILRILFSFGKIGIFIQDLLFSFFSVLITLLFLVAVNNGQLRGFIIIGEIAGAWLYFNSFSIFILQIFKFISKIINWCFQIIHKFLRWVFSPFYKFFCFIKNILTAKINIIKQNVKNIKRNHHLHLKKRKQIVYNKENNS